MIRPDEIAQIVLGILSIQSIYAMLLFPLVWGLVKCCRGRHPRWQHGLWFLILLRLILPPDMAAPWSAGHLIRSITPDLVSRPLPYASLIFLDHQKLISPLPDSFISDNQNSTEMTTVMGIKSAKIASSSAIGRLYLIVCSLWLAVVSLLIMIFIRKRHKFWKIARKGQSVLDPTVLGFVQTWRKRLHISRTVRVKEVVSNVPPFTIGLFRPVVALPRHLTSQVGSRSIEPVIAHELVHVKRWDDLVICLQEFVRIIYFFHPLVWFVMPRLNWTREAVCDTTVLSYGTLSPRDYGREMLAFVQNQAFLKKPIHGLAEFTAAAKSMAFRLKHIQKEDNMKRYSLSIYLAILVMGLFLLPMAPMVSSNQTSTTQGISDSASGKQYLDKQQKTNNALIRYILSYVPCQNPEEVSRIIWGDLIKENFQEDDFSRLIAATDCDIVENIGNGQKAFVFYLLASSRRGLYRPNFHFVKEKEKLMLLYKSRNMSIYATDRPKTNGRYEIKEGWRADLFDKIFDDRVNLAWASRVWFWTGTQYLPAYTDYTVKDTTDPSLLGTRRMWEKYNQSLYETSSRR